MTTIDIDIKMSDEDLLELATIFGYDENNKEPVNLFCKRMVENFIYAKMKKSRIDTALLPLVELKTTEIESELKTSFNSMDSQIGR